MKRRGFLAATLAVAGLAFGAPAQAESTYPDRPIKLVVPAAAGGVTDVPARIISERMRETLKQPLVVDNRGGAGGLIGSEAVQRADPDGYTLLYANAATHGLLPALKKTMPYDPLADFAPIGLAVRAPMAIVVRKDSPFHTMDDFIKGASKLGRPINYGSPGPGNTSHLVGLILSQASNTPMAAVHYRGEAPMIQDLLGGTIDFVASNVIAPHVQSGALRVLATTGDKRWFLFPDVPTLKELGHNAEFYAWSGFFAPAKTPQPIIDKVNASMNAALEQPEVRKALMATGLEVIGGKPQVLTDMMRSYIGATREIGRQNNIVLE